jgi:hypothetical protein
MFSLSLSLSLSFSLSGTLPSELLKRALVKCGPESLSILILS